MIWRSPEQQFVHVIVERFERPSHQYLSSRGRPLTKPPMEGLGSQHAAEGVKGGVVLIKSLHRRSSWFASVTVPGVGSRSANTDHLGVLGIFCAKPSA